MGQAFRLQDITIFQLNKNIMRHPLAPNTPITFFSDDYQKEMKGTIYGSTVITTAEDKEISYEVIAEETIKGSNRHHIYPNDIIKTHKF